MSVRDRVKRLNAFHKLHAEDGRTTRKELSLAASEKIRVAVYTLADAPPALVELPVRSKSGDLVRKLVGPASEDSQLKLCAQVSSLEETGMNSSARVRRPSAALEVVDMRSSLRVLIRRPGLRLIFPIRCAPSELFAASTLFVPKKDNAAAAAAAAAVAPKEAPRTEPPRPGKTDTPPPEATVVVEDATDPPTAVTEGNDVTPETQVQVPMAGTETSQPPPEVAAESRAEAEKVDRAEGLHSDGATAPAIDETSVQAKATVDVPQSSASVAEDEIGDASSSPNSLLPPLTVVEGKPDSQAQERKDEKVPLPPAPESAAADAAAQVAPVADGPSAASKTAPPDPILVIAVEPPPPHDSTKLASFASTSVASEASAAPEEVNVASAEEEQEESEEEEEEDLDNEHLSGEQVGIDAETWQRFVEENERAVRALGVNGDLADPETSTPPDDGDVEGFSDAENCVWTAGGVRDSMTMHMEGEQAGVESTSAAGRLSPSGRGGGRLAVGAVAMEGWLKKRGVGLIANKLRRRFFVLRGSQLFYYVSPSERKPKGIINLNEATLIRVNPIMEGFGLDILTPKRRWQLSADSEEDQNSWVEMLRLSSPQIATEALEEDGWSGNGLPPALGSPFTSPVTTDNKRISSSANKHDSTALSAAGHPDSQSSRPLSTGSGYVSGSSGML